MMMAPTVAPMKPAPCSGPYQPMACPRYVATKAPAIPRSVVRRKLPGSFSRGASHREMSPAMKPMMMMPMIAMRPPEIGERGKRSSGQGRGANLLVQRRNGAAVKPQAAREIAQIGLIGGGMVDDAEQWGGIDVRRHLRGLCPAGQNVARCRRLHFARNDPSFLLACPRRFERLMDARLLARIDMAVGVSSGDHRANERLRIGGLQHARRRAGCRRTRLARRLRSLRLA